MKEAKVTVQEVLDIIALINKLDGIDQFGQMLLGVSTQVKLQGDQLCQDIVFGLLANIAKIMQLGSAKKQELFDNLASKYNLEFDKETEELQLDAVNLTIRVNPSNEEGEE